MEEVVVVTGADAGVGRAVARAFATRGDAVALLARDEERLEATAKEIEAAGGRSHVEIIDVADGPAVEDAAARIERALGPITVWVNNAMVSAFSEFLEISDDEFRRVTEVTYHGYVHGTRAALSRMMPRDRGVVIQIGSALAYRGIPLQSPYCGAKHAVQGFTESVRCELLHHRSRVQIGMIQLPAMNTPQFDWVLSRLPGASQPVPPIYQPELVGRAVVAFADHPRREMWLGWSAIRAIVANRIAPGLLDRYLGRTAYQAQQEARPADADRPVNLWSPVAGDWEARGRFSDRAIDSSAAMWASRHRRAITIGAAAALAAATVAALRR
jgi:short-subunit dehydrogenase